MRFITSVIAGIVGAIVAAVTWVVAALVFPLALSGGGFTRISELSILAAALVGFIATFLWRLRAAGSPDSTR
jgi:hypothetical protein